jgi:putative addiction module component
MPLDVNSVLEEALALPEAERALVAAELLASIDDPAEDYSPEAADEFARDLERRIERVASGESAGIDYETAQRLLDEELARG